MRLALAALVPLVLAACEPLPAPPPFPGPAPRPPEPGPTQPRPPVPRLPPRPEPPVPNDTCGASQWQHLLNGPVPQPFPITGRVRIIPAGMAVTMDYDPLRLNVDTDRDRRVILRIHCG